MKKLSVLSSFIIFLVLATGAFAQNPPPGMAKALKDIRGRVYGKVVDASSGKPVEYASVMVLWYNKDSLLGGSLTEANGDFNVEDLPPMGGFRLRVVQVGYKTYETKFYIKMPDKLEQDLGDIQFAVDEKLLSQVEVVAEKSAVTMSIDKRTYNVDKDLSVRGGTAVDVMKNVPGVTVDADGNAQLRNQSPILYVDGRPTNLTLQQIPADQIDRVEVITNPSVKFDASATGGILNVVLKKNVKPGYNGMVMTYAGTGDRYGGMANLNAKEGRWNVSGMFSHNQATNIPLGYTYRTQLDGAGQIAGYFDQNNKTHSRNQFDFGRFGIDYALTNRNVLSLNGSLVSGQFLTNDRQNFSIRDAANSPRMEGLRLNDQKAAFQSYNGQLLYKRTFATSGKEFTADLNYNYNNSDNSYLFSTFSHGIPDTLSIADTYQKNAGKSNAGQFVFQSDYVLPMSETRKLEAGVKSFYKQTVSSNHTSNGNSAGDLFTPDSIMSNRYIIDDMVNAAYVNFSDKTVYDISYQAGLRFEASNYRGRITDKHQEFSYNYPSAASNLLKSIFPALYLSKKLSSKGELQVNFSRKIQRPHFFQLMPFVMFADKYNYRIGNPQLKPEFRNTAEINYNHLFGRGSYLGSVYGRYEEQPLTDIAYPKTDDPNVLVNTTINGSSGLRYGTEQTVKFTFWKSLDVTVNGNLFYVYIRGFVVPTQPEITATGYAFTSKAALSYRLPKQLTIQVNGNYESPRILLLGVSKPVYFLDLSVSKVISSKWSITAMVSDVFNSKRMGTHYVTPYYIQDLSRRRETRFARLSVTYIFGKMDASILKKARQQRNNNDSQSGQDGLDFGK